MRALVLIPAALLILAPPPATAAGAAMPGRSLLGSSVELIAPGGISPGQQGVFEFLVTNGSEDADWIKEVSFTFPEGLRVLDGWYDDSDALFPWDFDFGVVFERTARFTDGDGDFGEILGLESGRFFVSVEADIETECQTADLRWTLVGDAFWGSAEPHTLSCGEGDEDPGCPIFEICWEATGRASWSLVKSLY